MLDGEDAGRFMLLLSVIAIVFAPFAYMAVFEARLRNSGRVLRTDSNQVAYFLGAGRAMSNWDALFLFHVASGFCTTYHFFDTFSYMIQIAWREREGLYGGRQRVKRQEIKSGRERRFYTIFYCIDYFHLFPDRNNGLSLDVRWNQSDLNRHDRRESYGRGAELVFEY